MENIDKFNEFVAAQEGVAAEINRIYTNMKKDSPSRKSLPYFQERESRIQELFKKFEVNDERMKKLKITEHNYYSENYPAKIKSIYEQIIAYIRTSVSELPSPVLVTTLQPEVAESEENNRHLHLLKEQEIRLTDIETLIEEAEVELNQSKSNSRYEWFYKEIEKQWEVISNNNVTIRASATNPSSLNCISTTYPRLRAKYSEISEKLGNKCRTSSTKTTPLIKLPEIKIPIFSGQYEDWTTFHDIFTKIIHSNENLTCAEKMQYLKTYVKGEASQTIQNFQISDANYASAWKQLQERYDNKKLITFRLIGKIVEFPAIQHESAEKLKQLYNTFRECLEAIKITGIDTSTWDPIILYLITKKWDLRTNELYETSVKEPHQIPKLENVLTFIRTRFQTLESTGEKRQQNYLQPSSPGNSGKKLFCTYCKAPHFIYQCEKFKSLSVPERTKFINNNKLCYNCLNHNSSTKCKSTSCCRICERNHHTLLHRDERKPDKKVFEKTTDVKKVMSHLSNNNNNSVLLATALIKIKTSANSTEYFRALIDSGSQASFITEEAATLLHLPRQKVSAEITGLGSKDVISCRSKIIANCQPRTPSKFCLNTELLILPKLTNALPEKSIKPDLEQWKNCTLADPNFFKTGPIDVILGAGDYREIILEGIRKTTDGLLGQNTEFGWIVYGGNSSTSQKPIEVVSMISRVEEQLQLSKFWELEDISENRKLTSDEEYCENFFEKTTKRDSNGIYTVHIPFKENRELGDSRSRALARFNQLEKRLSNNKKLGQDYNAFMREYLTLGHMIPVPASEYNKGKFYIPHQAVIREDKTTTKLRVVFDASCRSKNGRSLNDIMHVGPRLQQEISDILLRWRTHKIVFTADVEKMYRQIKICDDDQDYHRILWRFDPNERIQEFKLTTVTYGTTAAPYLAVRTLMQLAEDEKYNFPDASKIAKNDFYVDDLLSGAESIDDAINCQQQLIKMFKAGGCVLRKWSSNSPELLENLPTALRDESTIDMSKETARKSLGVLWSSAHDEIQFKVTVSKETPKTKRTILAEVAKLFDPMGFLAPVIITAKLIIQNLWTSQLKWDDVVPESIFQNWQQYYGQLTALETIKLPRWTSQSSQSKLELHGFCDASEKAYGAVIYMKVVNSEKKEPTITLLAAKSKVAPLKTKTTLPRLELCSAQLLANLISRVTEALQLQKEHSIYAWSDSMIAIAWIKGDPTKWKTFVANRVSEINQLLSPNCWGHVISQENPADYISRSIEPSKLQEAQQWWQGPHWLSSGKYPSVKNIPQNVPEEKKLCLHIRTKIKDTNIFEKFSSKCKLTRVIAFCKRFAFNCKHPQNKQTGPLTVNELQSSLHTIIKIEQDATFGAEIAYLAKNKQLKRDCKLINLHPFIDGEGMLRVGGRLQNSSLNYDEKHPIILMSKNHLSELVIREAHYVTLHGGSQQTLAYVRRKYWVINGKKAVKCVINKCTTCLRHRAKTSQQLMGQLPTPRVTPSHPFEHTGMDLAGPIQIRTTKGRGNKSYKGYLVIFACLATKAVHLEVISDMLSETFLAAFRRFLSRRGKCAHLYCDNGTTFVGTKNMIEAEVIPLLKKSEIQDASANLGTQWHFIPPSAPHFGGLWEAAVKSTKHHLKRVIGEATLTFEELYTLITQIEACLNSRPLCPQSDDINDVTALTPGHFLVGREILAPPAPVPEEVDTNLSKRWKMVQKMRREFWSAWTKDYLHQLQQRYKWQSEEDNLKLGDMVLVKDDNIDPNKWPLGRIEAVHPDKNGKVRVVTVRKAKGNNFDRPIHKLIKLPVSDSHKNKSNTQEEKKKSETTSSKSKSPWKIAFIAILFIINLQQSVSATPYKIITPSPGLYVEHIGHVKINRGTFRIQVQFNKDDFKQRMGIIDSIIQETKEFCKNSMEMDTTLQCTSLIEELHEKRKQIDWIREGFQKLILRQHKRGLLGNFLTSIFGVNDEVYRDINELDKNQQELIRTSSHQTKFMLQVVARVNETESRINNNLERFRNTLLEGIEAIKDMQKWYKSINSNTLKIHILSVYQVASSYMDSILTYYSRLVESHFNKGHFYEFINPVQIEQLINNLTHKLPSNIEILTYPITGLDVEHTNENICVNGYFTLSEVTEYELIKTVAVPFSVSNNAYWSLQLTNDLMAIDYNTQYYFELMEEELRDCLAINKQRYVCTPTVIRRIETNPNCIIDQIYQRVDNISTCNIIESPINTIIWKQLYTPNTWLFISPEKRRIAVICNGQREDVKINETGIISITSDCIIKTNKNMLTPKRSANITVLGAFFKPVVANLTLSKINTKALPNLEESVVRTIDNIQDLQHVEESIEEELSEAHWKKITKHSSIISTATTISTAIIILLIIAGYKWAKTASLKKKNEAKKKEEHTYQDVEEIELQPLRVAHS